MYKDEATTLKAKSLSYQQKLDNLQAELDEMRKYLISATTAIPIKEGAKSHEQHGGIWSWQSYMWLLILEHIVNETPPSSVDANIVSLSRSLNYQAFGQSIIPGLYF